MAKNTLLMVILIAGLLAETRVAAAMQAGVSALPSGAQQLPADQGSVLRQTDAAADATIHVAADTPTVIAMLEPAVWFRVCPLTMLEESFPNSAPSAQKTQIVPPQLTSYAARYRSMQSAIEAAQDSRYLHVGIDICAGTYAEDLAIRTTKTLTLRGLGSGATITGTGAEYGVIQIDSTCDGTDSWCYGTLHLNNIHLHKNNAVTDYPRAGLYIDYAGWCAVECVRLDRAVVTIDHAQIDGFVYGVRVRGKVSVTVEDSAFTDHQSDGGSSGVIVAYAGGEIAVLTGTETAEDFASAVAPIVTVRRTTFSNNAGYLYGVMDISSGAVELEDVEIAQNSAGCVLSFEEATLAVITNATMHDNEGDVLCNASTSVLTIDASELSANHTTWHSAVINGSGTISISDSSIHDNTADTSDGAAVWFAGTALTATGTCWSNNTSSDVYHDDTSATFTAGCSDFVCDSAGCR